MKLVISSRMLGLAILAALAIPTAFADEWGGYVGGNFGRSSAKVNDARISDSLFFPGFATTSIQNDDRDNGFKLFGGFRINRYFAIEGGYYNLGQFGFVATTVPAGTLTGTIKVQGLNLDLVGSVPLGDKFSVFGRVGATYGETKDTFVGTGAVGVLDGNTRKRGGNYKFGAGLQYDFNHSVGVRAEAERYRVDDGIGNKDHVDLLSLGLIVRFGEVAEAPVPVAYTPPPPPPVVDCSAMDDDHDGVNNCNDRCPNSPAGQAVGSDGCPVPAPMPAPEPPPPPKPFRG